MRPSTIVITGTGTRLFPVSYQMDPPWYGIQTSVSATAGWTLRIEKTINSPWLVTSATTGSGFESTAVFNGVTGFGSAGTTTATQNGTQYVALNEPVSCFAITASSYVGAPTMLVTILPIGIVN